MPLINFKNIMKQMGGQPGRIELNDVENDDQKGFETNELFVLRTNWMKETTKKTIEIYDFTLKIEDEDKKPKISSPNFKLAGKKFSIDVQPDNIGSGYIAVVLQNCSKEDQMTSITVQENSGVERSWKMRKIPAGETLGFPTFLSIENYRELAKVNGDVLSLDVVLTLHTKAEVDGWTR